MIQIDRNTLASATEQGIIDSGQAEQLWLFLKERSQQQPSFRTTHILYYLGGLIAIGAMSLFMNLGWERFGGWGIFLIAIAYALAGILMANYFGRKGLTIPSGIMVTFVVVLAPLAIYGLQKGMGWWVDNHTYRDYHAYIDWNWFYLEMGTLAVAAVMLWVYKMPFSVMPLAVTLWYMSMDLTPFLFGEKDLGWELRKLVSLWFGLAMVLLAFWIDVRSRRGTKDFAFWVYLFGVMAFWGGLSSLHSDSELNKFIYLLINLALVAVGAILSRRVFAVFGGFGIAGYVGHLAYEVFKDSMMFPVVLTLIGIGVIYLGIIWQKHEEAISGRLRGVLPGALRELLVG